MDTILLAGAGGYIGLRIAEELKKNGYGVAAIDIRKDIPGLTAEYLMQCDLTKDESVEEVIGFIKKTKVKGIISAVGLVDYRADFNLLYNINVVTVDNLLKVYKKSYKSMKYNGVFLGSVASRGFYSDKRLIDEKSDNYSAGLSSYCDVKHDAEGLMREAAEKDNLPIIILEPGSLVGKEISGRMTTNIGLIKKIIKGFPVLKGGASYTSVNSVVKTVVSSLVKGEPGTYLTGGENMTMKEFGHLVLERYNSIYGTDKKNIIRIPVFLSVILGALGLVLSSQQVMLGNAFHFMDSTQAQQKLGYSHNREDLIREIDDILQSFEDPVHEG